MCSQLSELGRIVPVHPVAKSLRLFGLASREPENSSLAFIDEVVDAEFVNCGLGPQAKLFFHFHFNPQTLTVKPVLISQIVSGHRKKTLIGIFVRAAPGVMNSHRVVRCDRPVKKTPSLAAGILLPKLAKDLLDLPKLQN